jgi:hypothetical protein
MTKQWPDVGARDKKRKYICAVFCRTLYHIHSFTLLAVLEPLKRRFTNDKSPKRHSQRVSRTVTLMIPNPLLLLTSSRASSSEFLLVAAQPRQEPANDSEQHPRPPQLPVFAACHQNSQTRENGRNQHSICLTS